MEWNTNWNWENLDIFNSKGITSPKKLQSTNWGIEDGEEEDIDGSFNLSDMGNNSSAKSSISESSFKEGMKGSNFSFEGFACFPNAFSKKKEASVSSGEPFIGLKLGKRTYFENSCTKNNTTKTSSFAGIPVSSSVSTGKKVKSSYSSTPIPRCQVEGCNLDLSSAKEYHRKHRVCESHSKCPKVIVAGLERRFCQQCSRFHSMSEFDEEKRSCRRRLSDHNARRRKPHQETIRFNPTIPYSSFYDATLVETRGAISSCNSKYSVGEVKAEKCGDIDGLSHSVGVQLPHAMHMPTTLAFNGLVPSKGASTQIFDQGLKEASSVDLRSALSLLSNNSWDPNLFPLDHPMNSTNHTMSPQLHQGFPLSSPDYWQADTAVKTSNNHFQEFQIFKSFYSTSTPMDDLTNS